MPLRLYGLRNCDTCRKALRQLQAGGRQAEFIDLRSFPGLKERLPGWIASAGGTLVNRSSTTWRSLSAGDRTRADGPGLGALLLEYPTLIRRPLIEHEGLILTGWNDATRAAIGYQEDKGG